MTTKEQIKIIEELLKATRELIEHQEGWSEQISNGENLLTYLRSLNSHITKPTTNPHKPDINHIY